MNFKVELEGIERLTAAAQRFPQQVAQYWTAAGDQAAKHLLRTEGLRAYPPSTAANQPGRVVAGRKLGYYVRGDGWYTASGKAYRNSQRLGTQWTVQHDRLSTTIGNRTTYAPFVHGDKQARFHAARGWRKLKDVAEEKRAELTGIFQRWIDKALADLGF